MPIGLIISRAIVFLTSFPAGRKLPMSIACLSALHFQYFLLGVGNEYYLAPGQERRASGGVNMVNPLGLREG